GRRIVGWLASHRRDRIVALELLTFDKPLGLDLAFEMFRGDVTAGRGKSRINHGARSTADRARGRPDTRRLRAVPASPLASRRRCRGAASFWRVRQSAAGTGHT